MFSSCIDQERKTKMLPWRNALKDINCLQSSYLHPWHITAMTFSNDISLRSSSHLKIKERGQVFIAKSLWTKIIHISAKYIQKCLHRHSITFVSCKNIFLRLTIPLVCKIVATRCVLQKKYSFYCLFSYLACTWRRVMSY